MLTITRDKPYHSQSRAPRYPLWITAVSSETPKCSCESVLISGARAPSAIMRLGITLLSISDLRYPPAPFTVMPRVTTPPQYPFLAFAIQTQALVAVPMSSHCYEQLWSSVHAYPLQTPYLVFGNYDVCASMRWPRVSTTELPLLAHACLGSDTGSTHLQRLPIHVSRLGQVLLNRRWDDTCCFSRFV